MSYTGMPVIIPLLATGYLLTIYLLLMLAERTTKSSRYVANSLTDAYASYVATDPVAKKEEVERWSRSEPPLGAPSKKVQEASSIH